jgi:UDP-glucose 4-epimerase
VRGRICVTGGAGFIGSNLVDRLAAQGAEVVVCDNFRTGRHAFLLEAQKRPSVTVIEGDILAPGVLDQALAGCDTVIHLQANADVRWGFEHPDLDLEQNASATSAVLEAMRRNGVNRIAFTSTGSVYGEPSTIPTPEDCPFPQQTSLYGTSKAAAEGLISAYCHAFGFTGIVLRLVSILGERYTHGHVWDFYRSLRADPTRLQVLGDGRQQKSYLYVGDCIEAFLTVLRHEDPGFFVYNVGAEETLTVDESVKIISEHLGLSPAIEYAGGSRGWPGDSPLILLDTTRLRKLGWSPTVPIREAIARTVDWLGANPEIVFAGASR